MRGQSVLVEQFQDVVDDGVLRLSQEVRLREGGLRDSRMRILAAKLGDDVIEVLLGAETLPFEHFDDGGYLPHIEDGRFLDRHRFARVGVVAHWPFGVHSRANFCASAI